MYHEVKHKTRNSGEPNMLGTVNSARRRIGERHNQNKKKKKMEDSQCQNVKNKDIAFEINFEFGKIKANQKRRI